jgi:hypothetical protein
VEVLTQQQEGAEGVETMHRAQAEEGAGLRKRSVTVKPHEAEAGEAGVLMVPMHMAEAGAGWASTEGGMGAETGAAGDEGGRLQVRAQHKQDVA